MEDLRKHHNALKRQLIHENTKEGDTILDVGAGFGGDLKKWQECGANINMCDPSPDALDEARSRAKNMRIRVNFYVGDISSCPMRKYDVICYNFSMHYIFKTEKLFSDTLKEIRQRMKHGGKLFGIIPDSVSIIMKTPYTDTLGNIFQMVSGAGHGGFGERVVVELADTPYYVNGAIPEPLAYKDLLITHLERIGFSLQVWEPLEGHSITQLYSKFIFVYRK